MSRNSLLKAGAISEDCLCGMVDRQKAVSVTSSRDHCQISSRSRIFDTPRAGFEPAQNPSSGLLEWSCAVVITTILHYHHTKFCSSDEANLDFQQFTQQVHLSYLTLKNSLAKEIIIPVIKLVQKFDAKCRLSDSERET